MFFKNILFSIFLWLITNVLTTSLHAADWESFLKERYQEANAIAFYNHSKKDLFISQDPSIINAIQESQDFFEYFQTIANERFSNKKESELFSRDLNNLRNEKASLIVAGPFQMEALFWENIAYEFEFFLKKIQHFSLVDRVLFLNKIKKEFLIVVKLTLESLANESISHLERFHQNEVLVIRENISPQSPVQLVFQGELSPLCRLLIDAKIKLEEIQKNIKPSDVRRYSEEIISLINFLVSENSLIQKENTSFEKNNLLLSIYVQLNSYYSFLEAIHLFLEQEILEKEVLQKGQVFLEPSFFEDIKISFREHQKSPLIWWHLYFKCDRYGKAYSNNDFLRSLSDVISFVKKNLLQENPQRRKVSFQKENKKLESMKRELMQNYQKKEYDNLIFQENLSLQNLEIVSSKKRRKLIEEGHRLFWGDFQALRKEAGSESLETEVKKAPKKHKKKNKKKNKILLLEVKDSKEEVVSDEEEGEEPLGGEDIREEEEREERPALEPFADFSTTTTTTTVPMTSAATTTTTTISTTTSSSVPTTSTHTSSTPSSAASLIASSHSTSTSTATLTTLLRPSISVLPSLRVSDLEGAIEVGSEFYRAIFGSSSPHSPRGGDRGQVTGEDFYAWIQRLWRPLLGSVPENSSLHKELVHKLNQISPQGVTSFPLPHFNAQGDWIRDYQIYRIHLPHRSRDPVPYLTLKHFMKAAFLNAGFNPEEI